MKKVALAAILLASSLVSLSCAKIPEEETDTSLLEQRIKALETTYAQMTLNYEGVTQAQLRQLEDNLQAQIDYLRNQIETLEEE